MADGGSRVEGVVRFFFQAEDGIRDIGVTGVQTCALPISPGSHGHGLTSVAVGSTTLQPGGANKIPASANPTFTITFQNQGENDERDVVRSEERRGGEECRSRWSAYH